MRAKNLLSIFALILLSISPFIFMCCVPSEKVYDLAIINGSIIDGSGNPWFKADIGIKGKKIKRIGFIDRNQAKKVIDAQDLIISPGFIDVHTHCDRGILRVPTVDNYMLQGVTTVIGGNCGGHPYPLQDLFGKIKKNGISINFGCLIGHNTIRRKVMGYKMEPPTSEELEEMKGLIDQEMKAGGLGFSTGLSYLPGIYATTEELVNLASVVAQYGGIYATHLRNQGDHITDAIEEAIEIGEKNGIPVQISHIKLAEDQVWGETERITEPVNKARDRGVEILLDQYPYTATSSGFTSSFPSWAFEGGREEFQKRLEDRETYERIKSYVTQKRLISTKGIDRLETITIASYKKDPEYQGKNLKEILILQGKNPTVDNAADLIIEIEKNGGASGVFFQMDEKDVEELMKIPAIMCGSDGAVQVKGEGVPHPRSYGTFPRVIARYVREKRVITIEDAIRKMTSLPAQAFRLKGRGLIREEMFADITVFDLNTFQDKATFPDPHQNPQGLFWVVVNGKIIVENGKCTDELPGEVLYGPGKK